MKLAEKNRYTGRGARAREWNELLMSGQKLDLNMY
jgi:hypothetical protein